MDTAEAAVYGQPASTNKKKELSKKGSEMQMAVMDDPESNKKGSEMKMAIIDDPESNQASQKKKEVGSRDASPDIDKEIEERRKQIEQAAQQTIDQAAKETIDKAALESKEAINPA